MYTLRLFWQTTAVDKIVLAYEVTFVTFPFLTSRDCTYVRSDGLLNVKTNSPLKKQGAPFFSSLRSMLGKMASSG